MANANVPRGLIPYKYTWGQPYNGAYNIYSVPASYGTAIFIGDPLVPTGASDANGIPVVQLATAGSSNNTIGPMVGIVDGGAPNLAVVAVTRDMSIYHPASTNQYILVADDPNLLHLIQEDGTMTVATVGMKNANLVSGSGSTVTGYSGWQLQSSSVNTTNTLQLRIAQALRQADNTPGSANCKWLVRINLHSFTSTTGV